MPNFDEIPDDISVAEVAEYANNDPDTSGIDFDGTPEDVMGFLVDLYLEHKVEGDPSWGELADAQGWAEQQIDATNNACRNPGCINNESQNDLRHSTSECPFAFSSDIYIVAWTGGYEAPSYHAFMTENEAMRQAEEWWADADQDADSLDVLRINPNDMTITRVEAHRWASRPGDTEGSM